MRVGALLNSIHTANAEIAGALEQASGHFLETVEKRLAVPF